MLEPYQLLTRLNQSYWEGLCYGRMNPSSWGRRNRLLTVRIERANGSQGSHKPQNSNKAALWEGRLNSSTKSGNQRHFGYDICWKICWEDQPKGEHHHPNEFKFRLDSERDMPRSRLKYRESPQPRTVKPNGSQADVLSYSSNNTHFYERDNKKCQRFSRGRPNIWYIKEPNYSFELINLSYLTEIFDSSTVNYWLLLFNFCKFETVDIFCESTDVQIWNLQSKTFHGTRWPSQTNHLKTKWADSIIS